MNSDWFRGNYKNSLIWGFLDQAMIQLRKSQGYHKEKNSFLQNMWLRPNIKEPTERSKSMWKETRKGREGRWKEERTDYDK